MPIACDSTSLVAAATCYECQIPPGMQMSVLIWLMCQIAATGGGGSGASGQMQAANYGGGVPNWTPTGGVGIAFDTSTGVQWNYYNGTWN